MSGGLPGVSLIVVGATLFAIQLLQINGAVIVLVIGLVLAGAYAATGGTGC